MSHLRRASLGASFGYQPGAQPPDSGGWLKLNTNEAPIDAAPGVAEAVARAAVNGLRRYPSPDAEPLRTLLAARHSVEPGQVVVGNGADNVLDWCFRAWCEPGSTVVVPWPTYSLLETLAAVFSVRLERVPLEGWSLPRLDQPGSMRVVVNPNSPTGAWATAEEVDAAVGTADGVTLIDEAYADFAPASLAGVIGDRPQVVVRTLSKSFALAGLRIGYAVGPRELIEDLEAVRDSYPVDRCAIAGASAALADWSHHEGIVAMVRNERSRLREALLRQGWEVLPSEANFLLCRPPRHSAALIADGLRERHRILVRHFDTPELEPWLRISIGTADEMQRLLDALSSELAAAPG